MQLQGYKTIKCYLKNILLQKIGCINTCMESVRQSKVARLIQKELASFFQAESKNLFLGKIITVTVVRVTPDLRLAKIYVSIYPLVKDENFIAVINQHIKSIRNILGRNVRHQLKTIPELVFYLDDSLDYLEHIDELLKS